ncbi:phage protein Gp36 family protein [Bergeyella zoohelcum]|uniref:Mu-like prophage protein gp36 n=1 Tax=Bergeyella zoohelcum TaxID=1015 RepID=A0A380ZWG5_9FLAO|nr:phage protein Gp36 family protein [Bergeyella zoohelcum]EKB58401.1 hypothetical protein HMPREF9700_01853 [Bergeyella zoohelcum CCUG 30536]SUV53138.1 Mu-like prophage protein gp36 [Bergeyella zoohelcum]
MFTTIDDLKTHIYQYQIQQISEGNLDVVLRAIATAEEEVKSYFYTNAKKEYLDGRLRYDVEAIFSKQGAERHPLIVNTVVTVAVWHIIVLSNPDIIHDTIKDRYDRAIDWLKKINKGEISLGNLPLLKEDESQPNENNSQPFSFGSRLKFNH